VGGKGQREGVKLVTGLGHSMGKRKLHRGYNFWVAAGDEGTMELILELREANLEVG